jgi:ABC-type antimicrobial peptide transport system permease subunit
MMYNPREDFKDDANQRLINLHTYFYWFSPIALLLVFIYLGLLILYDKNSIVALSLRAFLILFFSVEFIIEMFLHEDKKKLLFQNIWKVLLIIPVISFLRILGHLAQIFKVLSLVKIAEQSVKSLNCYIFNDEN